jgi:2-polyprenyl-6-methoxyphenol hydroxylase-like FAD-dependent oxidoreductase
VVVARPHTERVVFLGDAAHAMSPQLGQGANLALYDAWVLSETVNQVGRDVPGALIHFAEQRRAHLLFYQWATRLLTPFFQSDAPLLGFLRDQTMGALCRLPFFSRQGLGAMAGYKTGVLGEVPVSRRLKIIGDRR